MQRPAWGLQGAWTDELNWGLVIQFQWNSGFCEHGNRKARKKTLKGLSLWICAVSVAHKSPTASLAPSPNLFHPLHISSFSTVMRFQRGHVTYAADGSHCSLSLKSLVELIHSQHVNNKMPKFSMGPVTRWRPGYLLAEETTPVFPEFPSTELWARRMLAIDYFSFLHYIWEDRGKDRSRIE